MAATGCYWMLERATEPFLSGPLFATLTQACSTNNAHTHIPTRGRSQTSPYTSIPVIIIISVRSCVVRAGEKTAFNCRISLKLESNSLGESAAAGADEGICFDLAKCRDRESWGVQLVGKITDAHFHETFMLLKSPEHAHGLLEVSSQWKLLAEASSGASSGIQWLPMDALSRWSSQWKHPVDAIHWMRQPLDAPGGCKPAHDKIRSQPVASTG